MFITWSSDFIYVIAMMKTTPLVVTVGLSLTIPVAVVGDALLNRPASAKVIGGAALVLIGFVVVGWENARLSYASEGTSVASSRAERGRSRTASTVVTEAPDDGDTI
jgi:solute carrier family 35 protein F5